MNAQSLKYLTIGLKELNHTHQFYFDANDFISTIQGVQRFYESPSGREFQKEKFEEENSDIHSLLFSGLLGESVKLLPPHQAELSDKLKKGRLFKKVENHLLNQFLSTDLGFFEKLNEISNVKIDKDSTHFISSWVEKKGKEMFKTIFNSYKLNHEERLVELFDNNILQIESYELDDIEIYNHELFNQLSEAFSTDKRRGKEDWSENNFRDVIALMYLAKKVRAFNKDTKKPIPIFFDSQNFAKIVPQILLKEHFTIKYNGIESLALRTQNYFKIYSLLKYNPPYKDKPYEVFLEQKDIIGNLINDLNQLELIESVLGTQHSLEDRKHKLDQKINEYFSYDFFISILLRTFISKKDIIDKILKNSKTEFDLDGISILKTKAEAILEKFTSEINELVYNSAYVYKEIEKRFIYVKNLSIQLKSENKTLDIFHDYSLFRFFIPEKYSGNLSLLFSEDGVLSNNENVSRTYLINIWNLYYRTINNKKDLEEYELFDLYATFWILNLHELVIKFKFSFSRLHHSLLMLKGACLNRAILEMKGKNKSTQVHTDSIKRIIQVLYRRLLLISNENQTSGEINIVIAYLYFHLWVTKGNKLILEGGNEIDKIVHSNFNQKAIKFAYSAYNYFDKYTSENNPYRVYALNIYIYFVIDTSTIENFIEIKELRQEFLRLKGKIKDWHFRYDDTIARNFHRLALLQETNEEKLEVLQNAIDGLKETIDNHKALESRDINEVRAYLSSLIDYKAELKIRKQ